MYWWHTDPDPQSCRPAQMPAHLGDWFRFRVGTFNIHYGTHRRELKVFLSRIEPPLDLLALQETPEQVAKDLATELGMSCIYAKAGFGGNALLSRFPIRCAKDVKVKVADMELRSAIICTVALPLTRQMASNDATREELQLTVAATHLDHKSEPIRLAQYQQLQSVLAPFGRSIKPRYQACNRA